MTRTILRVLTALLVAACSRSSTVEERERPSSTTKPITWQWASQLQNDSAVFLPDIVSLRDRVEQGITFSTTGDTLVFSAIVGRRNNRNLWALLWSSRLNGQWSTPDTLPFSGTYSDYGPAFAPDDRTLYFSSRRPITDTSTTIPEDYDLWKVKLRDGVFDDPVRLADGVNTNGNEYSVGVSYEQLVICADRNDALGRSDLYIVPRSEEDNDFNSIRNMGPPISTAMWEGQAYLSPRGDRLWWNYVSETEGESEDIYFSIRNEHGWQEPERLNSMFNSAANEFMHCTSPDNAFLFFGRHGDILSAPLR